MRKLVGGLARFSSPLLATALIVGCQAAEQNSSDAVPGAVAPLAGEQGQIDEILELCGWECKAFADGEVNISGVKELDAFFAASATLQAQALSLRAEIRAELVSIAAALGVEGAASMQIDQLTAAIEGKVSGGFDGQIEGGISIGFTPPKCEVSASASLEAAAKCDASIDPGSASVKCEGTCEVEASAMASCSGSAELKCKGTPPSFSCSAECTGTCELEAGGSCEGECTGSCEVSSAAECDGEFTASTEGGASGGGTCKLNAGATCSGSCRGSCELKAGGSCSGQCKGECEYDPGDVGCQAGATAQCKAEANAQVDCSGKCSGEVTPPSVSAECEATAKAEAQFAAECHPPSVDVKYNLTADAKAEFSGSASARAAFEGKIQAIGKAFANIQAKGAKIEGVLQAGGGLVTAGVDAVGSFAGTLASSGDARLIVGGYCAGNALGAVGAALNAAVGDLQVTTEAVVEITGTFGT